MKKTILPFCVIIFLLISQQCSPTRNYSAANTALLIIDVQNAYLPIISKGSIIPKFIQLKQKAEEAEVPVIYIRNINNYNKPGTKGWKFKRSLKPKDNDYIVEKNLQARFLLQNLKRSLGN